MTEGREPPARRRDAAATRAALLAAATELFNERGFDRATVRDIAERAGVNQALLFRYFGTKDELFALVIANRSRELINSAPPERLVGRTLDLLLDPDSPKRSANPLVALLRSSSHDEAAAAIRAELGDEYTGALAALTGAEDADVRAVLVLAWLLGIGLLRSVLPTEPLASADPQAVRDHVLRAVRTLLERVDIRPGE
ncbi:TetR/AcrR family transcriptional regulator [Goodfellowiella coeruleoviolacea]|uniref:Transcriptional regulator, TetR family n=1 Tax=Goodfellowiella coeruleoviolacea TaxID=334858 RepID=A0AAE3GC74_9PSEU|nr:TetR family transcriptional regulator [Goodfellowiella coeruleoviolacea]MCP2165123.1 transcriptional regulator, TetR family [Goodfellowiella coeruleoviolacea]